MKFEINIFNFLFGFKSAFDSFSLFMCLTNEDELSIQRASL